MKSNDYIIDVDSVTDRREFFNELLSFYAQMSVVLTLWGELPKDVFKSLDQFNAPCSWIRRWLFKQTEWNLNPGSVNLIKQKLSNNDLLEHIRWGLIKADIPLGNSLSWEDISLHGSDLIEERALCNWLDNLKKKKLIQSYEIITD